MYQLFQAGQQYLNSYPHQKKLGLFMPDYRMIQSVKFAKRFMPAFACFAFIWQFLFNDAEQVVLINALICALFALSLPFQCLIWLGKRAKSPLPLHLIEWYETLRHKLIAENHKLIPQTVPTYQHFADLLQLAEKTWGQTYFDEL